MANQTLLPPADTLERYLAVRADQARLQPGVTALCERLGLRGADIVRFADGSLPVYAVGHNRVLKLYPGAFHPPQAWSTRASSRAGATYSWSAWVANP